MYKTAPIPKTTADRIAALERELAEARARIAAKDAALRAAFITCVAGDGDPYVKVQFKELAQAYAFLDAIEALERRGEIIFGKEGD
jgi:hypothetical protein